MKLGRDEHELDDTDRRILAVIQDDCKTSLARIGESVDLSAPAVVERIRKLEDAGVIQGYRAILDAKRLGLDIMAFIGVSIDFPRTIDSFERELESMPGVLECHHVTGGHSLLIKVRTRNTAALEALISQLRSIRGVIRTETMVVLSTRSERTFLPLDREPDDSTPPSTPRKRTLRARKKSPSMNLAIPSGTPKALNRR